MTILVTGAAGFIGSNFVKYLNGLGIEDICVSDYLTNGRQFTNLKDCVYSSFVTPDKIDTGLLKYIKHVHHFGAISDTTEWNGELVLQRNYNYTVELISKCVALDVPVSYSSSASVYGNGDGPLNLYAYSKWLVDEWVRAKLLINPKIRVQGWRYFNVWGPGEWHKGKQASPFWQFEQQALETGEIKIFEGSENYLRDFVHVDKICEVQWKFAAHGGSGIYDLGSGSQMSFRSLADRIAWKHGAKIVEVPFPQHLKDCYQFNTLADMETINNVLSKYS